MIFGPNKCPKDNKCQKNLLIFFQHAILTSTKSLCIASKRLASDRRRNNAAKVDPSSKGSDDSFNDDTIKKIDRFDQLKIE
jgi:hypothetical protein